MKITISKDELSQGVQTIQSALSSRTTLPILLNFLMETEDKKVKVVSTDLEMGVKHYLKAEIESDGSITIPAKKFADILHSLPDAEDVELSVDAGGKVSLKCGRSRFGIVGAPKSEYPVLPDFNKTSAFELPAALVGEMVRKTIFAASSDETRHVLNGVFWAAKKGALEMVATDGRRLAVVSKKILPKEKEFSVIVPTKVLAEFLRLLSVLEIQDGDAEKMMVAVTENQITFQLKGTTLLSRLVGGSFPNYEQVIPKTNPRQFSVSREELIAGLRRVAVLADSSTHQIKMSVRPERLELAVNTADIGEGLEQIPVTYTGDRLDIGYNSSYLLELLRSVDTANVTVHLNNATSAGIFKPEGLPEGEDLLCLVMPLRLPD